MYKLKDSGAYIPDTPELQSFDQLTSFEKHEIASVEKHGIKPVATGRTGSFTNPNLQLIHAPNDVFKHDNSISQGISISHTYYSITHYT